MNNFLVIALYKFIALDDFETLQSPLLEKCQSEGVMGTLLIAHEGINGSIAGPEQGVRSVLKYIRQDARLVDLVHKEAWAKKLPFLRMKVRLKKEIVTMGVENIDPVHSAGTYVEPEDWNALILDPNVIVIDTRNDYEVEIGTFKGSINPKTTSFREFPEWVKNSDLLEGKKKIAMFCTGGIRCEKSTAYMRQLGVKDVLHLRGGILKYLEAVPLEKSLWEGECFVFDERVSVRHGLEQGTYDMCHGCRHAIDDSEKKSNHYIPGVCCPKCYRKLSEDQKARFAERQKQIILATARGEVHMGQAPKLE
jgi:UPF0176 protein